MVDIQTVLGTLVVVRFSSAPVGIQKHSSITPQPMSILKSEESEYKEWTTVIRLQEEANSVQIWSQTIFIRNFAFTV